MVKEYRVSVEKCNEQIDLMDEYSRNEQVNKYNCSIEEANKDAQYAMLYDTVKSEYEHCVKRSEKLDNKVYIMFTVCAILAVMFGSVIEKIGKISLPKTRTELYVIIVYMVALSACVGAFLIALIKLSRLIKPIEMKRFNPLYVYKLDYLTYTPKTAFRMIIQHYNESISVNDSLLEKYYRDFKMCVCLIIFVMCDLISLYVCCQFI